MKATRRDFVAKAIASSAVSALLLRRAPYALAGARAKIVIVGAGVGGLIAARTLAKYESQLEIILVEGSTTYVSNFNSNLYIGGLAGFDQIAHSYDKVASLSAIKFVNRRVLSIDRGRKTIRLGPNDTIAYDRLLISPGVDLQYDSVPGWGKASEDLMPHAWQGIEQTRLLKSRLDAVEDGGLIVVLAPPNPYACPPGPYERVSMMARSLHDRGKRNCKIVILDSKESFSMQGLFEEGWENHYPGMVEWIDAAIYETIQSVDPKSNTVVTGFETYRNASLVNVIPAQVAGRIAREASLVDARGYCPIDAATMRSTRDPNIYVLGDASRAGDMPKSAYAARSQAKAAVASICGELLGMARTEDTYESICWSEIDRDDAIKFASRYEFRDGRIRSVASSVSQTGEEAKLRQLNQQEKIQWSDALASEMFS
jgi:NADH dehydrogenase FAD-containing subunit